MERITASCLLTGASGFLGKHIYATLVQLYISVVGLCHSNTYNGLFTRCNLTRPAEITACLSDIQPDIIIHSAAMRDPDACEDDPDTAKALHVTATDILASYAASHARLLVYISTDYVFDGASSPYREEDAVTPLSVYGTTKALGEDAARKCAHHLIVRIPLQYGYTTPNDDAFILKCLAQLNRGGEIGCDDTQKRYPTLSDDIAVAVDMLTRMDYHGTVHVSAKEVYTRYSMMKALAQCFSYPDAQLVIRHNAHTPRAQRPNHVQLDCTRFHRLTHMRCTSFEEGIQLCKDKMIHDTYDWRTI